MFNTLKQAIDSLGEVKVLNMVNAQAKNVDYRKKRNLRVKAELKEAKDFLQKVKSDPKFAAQFKTGTKG